jgi:hypothetical protein
LSKESSRKKGRRLFYEGYGEVICPACSGHSVKNQLGNRNWLRKYNPEVATSEIRGAAEAIINLSYEVEDLINQYISGDSGD